MFLIVVSFPNRDLYCASKVFFSFLVATRSTSSSRILSIASSCESPIVSLVVPLEGDERREGESGEATAVASATNGGGIAAKLEVEGGEMDDTEDAKSIEVRGEAVDMDEEVVGGSSSSNCG